MSSQGRDDNIINWSRWVFYKNDPENNGDDEDHVVPSPLSTCWRREEAFSELLGRNVNITIVQTLQCDIRKSAKYRPATSRTEKWAWWWYFDTPRNNRNIQHHQDKTSMEKQFQKMTLKKWSGKIIRTRRSTEHQTCHILVGRHGRNIKWSVLVWLYWGQYQWDDTVETHPRCTLQMQPSPSTLI